MTRHIDFSAMEPDAGARELMVAAIMMRARPELARRARTDVSPIVALHDWARPALAAAAVLAVICVSVLAGHSAGTPAPGAGLTDALEVPSPMDEWLVGERSPTVADLLLAMEGD